MRKRSGNVCEMWLGKPHKIFRCICPCALLLFGSICFFNTWNVPTQRYSEILSRPWQTCDISKAQRLKVFPKSGMHGCIHGKQKRVIKEGNRISSNQCVNAKEFWTIVSSLQEVISPPINYVPCRSSRPLWRERPSLLSCVCAEWSNHADRQCALKLPVMGLPCHFSDKEQWPLHN